MSPFTCKFPIALLLSAAFFPLPAQTGTASSGVAITVTSSANPSVFAQPVTFTILVAAPAASAAIPTGTVTATLPGPVGLGTATLDKTGKATITVPPLLTPAASRPNGLPAGDDAITFTYSGDQNYAAAKSQFLQFVRKADSTTTAAVVGNSVPSQLTATVSILEPSAATGPFSPPGNLSSSSPTGTVTFYNGDPATASARLIGSAELSPSGLFSSTASLLVDAIPATLVAVYSGDSNYNGSISPPAGGTGKGAVTLNVATSDAQATFAEPLTFTVAVVPSSAGAVPTGSVSASLLGIFGLGSAALDGSGKASITVPASLKAIVPWGLPAGSDSIAFSYSGDGNYSGAQTSFTQNVAKAATATTATISPSATRISATVAINESSVSPTPFALPGADDGNPNPAGLVQFLNGTTVIGTAPLVPSGLFKSTAIFEPSHPFSASDVLTAVYSGDSNYNGSTSPPATVPNLPGVTVGVQSSANPATFAEPVTLSITVTPSAAAGSPPTGMVQASVMGDVLGAAILDANGKASIVVPPQSFPPYVAAIFPWGFATGANVVTVAYTGDANYAPGQSTFTQTVTQSATTTTLIPAPEAFGSNSLTVLARVAIDEPSVSKFDFRIPAPGDLSTSPTGSIDFFDGATLLKTVTLNPGVLFESTVTFTTSPLPVALRAVYHGDTNYTGSTSETIGTGNGSVTVSLKSSATPALYGAGLAIMATVAPATAGGPTPTGTVQFFDGPQNLVSTATLDAGGQATLKFPLPMLNLWVCLLPCPSSVLVLGAGSHNISAQYSGDANYAPATTASPLVQQIGKAPTTTSVTSILAAFGVPVGGGAIATVADSQPPAGGPYHFQALTANGMVDGNPSGKVTFYAGTNTLGTGTLTPSFSGNVASTAILGDDEAPSIAAAITATYPGDDNFQGSSSQAPGAASVSLSGNPNPSNTDQSVTLTATVTTSSATPAPTGTVSFFDGKTPLGFAPLSGTTATVSAIFTTAGAHSLTAVYSGDSNYQGAISPAYTQTVNTSTTPTDSLKLTLSTTIAVFGQRVVLFAQVIGNVNVPPFGTVDFLDGSTNIGSGTLSLGTAWTVVALPIGTHQISAAWAGDSNWPAATSGVVTLRVNPANTIVRLSGFDGTWTAVVTPLPPGQGTPTGTVQFIDSVTQAVLATGTLSNGAVTVSIAANDPVQAVYSGDADFNASKSRNAPTAVPRPRR